MGIDRTPDYDLSGILVPWTWDPEYSGDSASGSDYTEAERRPGRSSYSGGVPRMALEASGELDGGVTADLEMQVVRPGVPGASSAGVVVREGSGEWYGRDLEERVSHYERLFVATGATIQGVAACPLEGGIAIVATSERVSGSGTSQLRIRTVAEDGTVTLVETFTAPGTLATDCTACIGPDGRPLVYWAPGAVALSATIPVRVYVGSKDGTSWSEQQIDTEVVSDGVVALHAETATDGTVVLFRDAATGCTQYGSRDGGYTFEAVDTVTSAQCKAVTLAGPFLVVATLENDGGTLTLRSRRVTSAFDAFGDTVSVDLDTGVDTDVPAHMATRQDGTVVLCAETGLRLSRDLGLSWSDPIGPGAGSHAYPVGGEAVAYRGALHAFTQPFDDTGAASALSTMWVVRGGTSQIPTSGPMVSGSDWSGALYEYLPSDDPGNFPDFTETVLSGSPSTSLTFGLGYLITNGAADRLNIEAAVTSLLDAESRGIFVLRVTGGTVNVAIEGAPASMTVRVTDTQIGMDETGTSPTMTNHGIATTEYIEVAYCINGRTGNAQAWYRQRDFEAERAWTQINRVTGLSDVSADADWSMTVPTDTEAYLLVVSHSVTSAEYYTSGLASADPPPITALTPIPVPSSGAMYAYGGVSVSGRGGPVASDGETYTVPIGGSPYRKANVDPRVAPSPRAVWRSDGTSASPVSTQQDLTFTLDPESGADMYSESVAWGIYLDGLVGVPKVTVVEPYGSVSQAIDLRTSMRFRRRGTTVTPNTSGATGTNYYVQADELAGGYFEFPNGDVRRIVGNSNGTLTDGEVGPVATLRLEDVDGGENTSGTGYIWPPRAMLFFYAAGQPQIMESVTLRILSGTAVGPEGYREIGVAAIGPIQVLGRAFDRTMAIETGDNVDVQDYPDGSSSATTRGPLGRVVEFAFVESHTDLTQVRGDSTSPDYVTVSEYTDDPAAALYAVPVDVEGVYRRLGGSRYPCVAVRRIPRGADSSQRVYAETLGLRDIATYGRLTQPVRREQIQVGRHGVDDAERVATLVVTEEV